MQLVAYGAQDIYLTGNPQITFFKVVYRRHTNFALEAIEQTFQGSADFGKKVTCTISRNGDLIHRTYLRVELPDVVVPVSAAASAGNQVAFRWLDWVGHALIKSVELEIGGQKIDKHYAAWLHIWNELTQTAGHALGYSNMVGNTSDLTTPYIVTNGENNRTVAGKILYIPLQFWFCRNPGLALPLIALQYHEVKINLELEEVRNLYFAGRRLSNAAGFVPDLSAVSVPSLKSASLYVDYIYLDTDERRRFAQVSHEYLIEQLQFTGDESTSNVNNKIKLNFNHPVKELVWVVQPDEVVTDPSGATYVYGKQWFNFTDAFDTTFGQQTGSAGYVGGAGGNGSFLSLFSEYSVGGANPTRLAKLQLNGHDRFSERDGRYFNLVQPYQHHTNVPARGINVYSFGLKPEDHQPSGTCNMSRIDNATLNLILTAATVAGGKTAKVKVFAVNYNVLRIMSGMGGLAYSN